MSYLSARRQAGSLLFFFVKRNVVAKFTLLLFRASSETTILFVAAKRQLCSVIANMHLANLLKQSLPICSSKALSFPLQIFVLLLLFHCRPNPATTIKNYFVIFLNNPCLYKFTNSNDMVSKKFDKYLTI